MDAQKLSSGVQELIDRLREDGVAEGRNEAAKIVAQAKEEAGRLVEEAQKEATAIISNAKSEAEKFRKQAADAMEIAGRDTILELKSQLISRFSRRVSEMISENLDNEDFLEKVILEIAGNVREKVGEEEVEVLLPADVIGLDELRRHPEKVREGSLGQFVLTAAEDMFRKGVTIRQGDQKKGIRIRLVESSLEIDINEKVIGEILMSHLLPRFRALLEGSIQ